MPKSLCLLCCGLLLMAGCTQHSIDGGPGQQPPTSSGLYVLNEGDFGDPSGARLSFYDITADSIYQNVFEGANGGLHLGSLGDDLVMAGGLLYALMSGSENLVVINPSDNRQVRTGSYPGAVPHDLLVDVQANRLYLTQLFSASVLVVDLSTLGILQSIPVGLNPQGMVRAGEHLFVCNSGYGADNTVSAINVMTDAVTASIIVGDGPTGIAEGPDGMLWVACSGNQFGSPGTTGSVYMIDPVNLEVVDSVMFQENLWGAISVGTDGMVYVIGADPSSFFGGPLHRIDPALPAPDLAFIAGTFYGVGIEPVSGDIYLTDANDFSGDGEVHIYDRTGLYRKSFYAQRGPGSLAFSD